MTSVSYELTTLFIVPTFYSNWDITDYKWQKVWTNDQNPVTLISVMHI